MFLHILESPEPEFKRSMTFTPRRLLPTAAVLILLVAGCGNADTDDAGTATAGAVETAETGHGHEDSGTTGGDHDHDHHDHDHGSAGAPTRYDADVADAVQTITIDIVDGEPVGGVQREEVALGSVVGLMVTSDIAEEVHVHGYDILRAVSEGHPAHFAFNAEIPGVFEVELEGSGRLLMQLEIS